MRLLKSVCENGLFGAASVRRKRASSAEKPLPRGRGSVQKRGFSHKLLCTLNTCEELVHPPTRR